MTRDLASVPSVVAINRAHVDLTALNGIGESCIGGVAHNLLPHEMTALLHPVHVKESMYIRRPLQNNGGQLHTLWKMKGSQALINNHRDITLSDQDSKVSGRAVRSQTIPATKVITAESQLGSGFHCGSTDAARLLCNAPLALGALLNKTSTQLFVDVTKAFPKLLRRIVLPGHIESEELWRRHLVACGMNHEQVEAIINMACTVLKWQMAGCTEHNLAMLEAAHLHTWFSLEGLRFIVVFIGGCAAGTPLADLLFIIAMAILISCMEMDLEAAGLVYHFDASG